MRLRLLVTSSASAGTVSVGHFNWMGGKIYQWQVLRQAGDASLSSRDRHRRSDRFPKTGFPKTGGRWTATRQADSEGAGQVLWWLP